MITDDLLSLAHRGLDELLDRVSCDGATWSHANGKADAETAIRDIRRHIDHAPGINPAYAPMGSCAAALVLLHVTDRAAWDRLTQRIATALAPRDTSPVPGTLAGLVGLANLIGYVCDDHDFSLDPHADAPVLALQDSLPAGTPTVTPASLLEALAKTLTIAPTSPTATGPA